MPWEEHLVFDRCNTPELVVSSKQSFLIDVDGTEKQSVADARINHIRRASNLRIEVNGQSTLAPVRAVDIEQAQFTVEIAGHEHVLVFKSVLINMK